MNTNDDENSPSHSVAKVQFRTAAENQNRENRTEVRFCSVSVLLAWQSVLFSVLLIAVGSRTGSELVRTANRLHERVFFV